MILKDHICALSYALTIYYLIYCQLLICLFSNWYFWNFYQFFIPAPLNLLRGLVIDVFFNLKEMKELHSDVIVTSLE